MSGERYASSPPAFDKEKDVTDEKKDVSVNDKKKEKTKGLFNSFLFGDASFHEPNNDETKKLINSFQKIPSGDLGQFLQAIRCLSVIFAGTEDLVFYRDEKNNAMIAHDMFKNPENTYQEIIGLLKLGCLKLAEDAKERMQDNLLFNAELLYDLVAANAIPEQEKELKENGPTKAIYNGVEAFSCALDLRTESVAKAVDLANAFKFVPCTDGNEKKYLHDEIASALKKGFRARTLTRNERDLIYPDKGETIHNVEEYDRKMKEKEKKKKEEKEAKEKSNLIRLYDRYHNKLVSIKDAADFHNFVVCYDFPYELLKTIAEEGDSVAGYRDNLLKHFNKLKNYFFFIRIFILFLHLLFFLKNAFFSHIFLKFFFLHLTEFPALTGEV